MGMRLPSFVLFLPPGVLHSGEIRGRGKEEGEERKGGGLDP